jgi:hypothetical protein
MKSNLWKFSLAILIIVLFLSGCEVIEKPTTEGGAAVHANQIPLADLQADVSQFDSFVMESVFEIFDGETGELLQATTTTRSYRNDPPAESVVMEQKVAGGGVHGTTSGGKTLELITVDGVMYSLGHSAGCMTMPADDAETRASLSFLDATTLFDSLQDAQRLHPDPAEPINGVKSKHYRFDETVYAPQSSDAVDVEGHLYLAVSDNHLVRLIIEGVDPQMANEEGITADDRFRLEYNVLGVNQPVEITIPSECEEEAGVIADGEQYPMMPDATQALKLGVMQTYKTQATDEEILAFYQETLGEQGWTFDDEQSIVGETGGIWLFVKDDKELQVMTGSKGGGKKTFVSLLESEAAAEDSGERAQEEALPRMADASDVLSLSDTEMYKTGAAAEEILAFYTDELEARGWRYDPEATQLDERGAVWVFRGTDESIRILVAAKGDDMFVTVQRVRE